jgi:hypothetical protein
MAIMLPELPLLYAPQHETLHSAWKGHRGFAQRLIKALQPEVFVELGVHAGDSYFTIVETMRGGKAYGVDTWAGDKHAGFYDDGIHNMVCTVNKQYPFSTLLRMPFDQAVGAVDEISLLHIDGLHTYEAVKHDYEMWEPKVRDVILLHDICVPENPDFGVWKLWAEIKNDKCFEFNHCHGLAVFCKSERGLEAVKQATRPHNPQVA